MKNITTLTDFIKYCESVIEDSNELFLLSILAANLTKEELLIDVEKCLKIYYKWLKKAEQAEAFHLCAIIWKAHGQEITHYNQLGKAVLKKSIAKDIKAIDNKLKEKHVK